ncbi:MAG: DUF2141 domain-containing protein [Bacteroidales bacterium]|nr:DUF2141 domain-containing protein [Bacteroidales bacterium]
MNIKLYRLLLLVSFILISSGAKPPPQKYQLTLKVTGIKEIKGGLVIGLYNNQKAWLKKGKEFSKKTIKITAKKESIVFDNIPAGNYAISLFHDENMDGKVNKSLIGIPKEGYGFSNNVKPRLKAPSFKHASFTLSNDTTIQIKLRY